MKGMTWFRFYQEALDDEKVQALDPWLFKGWVNLLCLAAKRDGIIPGVDSVAFSLRLSPQSSRELIDALILAELIDIRPDGKMEPHAWNARQYRSDSSAERTRKYRERKKKQTSNDDGDGGVTSQVTPPESETDTDTDSEIITSVAAESPREAAAATADDLAKLSNQLFEAAKPCLASHSWQLENLSIPLMWIDQGCDLERDVLPVLKAMGKRDAGKQITTWKYFSGAVSQAKRDREAGLPAAGTPGAGGSDVPPWVAEKRRKNAKWMALLNGETANA